MSIKKSSERLQIILKLLKEPGVVLFNKEKKVSDDPEKLRVLQEKQSSINSFFQSASRCGSEQTKAEPCSWRQRAVEQNQEAVFMKHENTAGCSTLCCTTMTRILQADSIYLKLPGISEGILELQTSEGVGAEQGSEGLKVNFITMCIFYLTEENMLFR